MFVSLLLPLGGDLVSSVIESTAHAGEVGATRPGAKKPKKKGGGGDAGTGPFKKGEYPIPERLRPLVLPNSMGEVTPQLALGFTDPLSAGLGATFKYGFGNKVEVGVGTGLLLAPEADWNSTIALQGHFLAYDSKEIDFAPGLQIPLQFVDGAQVGTSIDLTTRWVPSKFFLQFGHGAIGIVAASDVGLSVNGNVRLGYQVDQPVVLFLDTNVFTLNLAPETGFTGLWEYLNLQAGVQGTPSRTIDVGGALTYFNLFELEGANGVGANVYGRFRF